MVVKQSRVDVAIVGAGPAGLAAASLLAREGLAVVVMDREPEPGGLPAQCLHAGFGLWRYRRLLPGREFAKRLADEAAQAGARFSLETTVLRIGADRAVLTTSPQGVHVFQAQAVVLATGCRESPRSARLVPGSRPAGVYTTGIVQRLETFLEVLPGRNAVIVGSDDPGLVAAAELDRLGCRVVAVVEERPYRQGYWVNQFWSLSRRRIPLLVGYRVCRILGDERVTGLEVTPWYEHEGSSRVIRIACDTVIFSGEFLPENTLARQAGLPLDPATGGPVIDQWFTTEVPGIFACGNLVHAADSADRAAADGERAARGVLRYLRFGAVTACVASVRAGNGVRAVVPQRLRWSSGEGPAAVELAVRVAEPLRPALIRARRGTAVLGRAAEIVAKPQRSVPLDLRAVAPCEEEIVVTAWGFPLVRADGKVGEP